MQCQLTQVITIRNWFGQEIDNTEIGTKVRPRPHVELFMSRTKLLVSQVHDKFDVLWLK